MEFADVVRRRRMVRHFKPDPVPQDVLDRMLSLAQHVPSAGFSQGQAFVVVRAPATRQALADLCGEAHYVTQGFHRWISEAPVVVIACTSESAYRRRYQEPDKHRAGEPEMVWPVPYWHMDVGCSVMVLLLAAVDAGLAAGFAGIRDHGTLRALLGIPEEMTPVGAIPIGYRDQDVPSPSLKRGRKALTDFVHFDVW